MQLTKMKRCQKAAYGYKGQFTGENLFQEVEQLKQALGATPNTVETKKHPGVKVPGWFINLEPAAANRYSSGTNSTPFKVYVNDENVVNALASMLDDAPPKATLESTIPSATSAVLARLMSRPSTIPDNIELFKDVPEISGDLESGAE